MYIPSLDQNLSFLTVIYIGFKDGEGYKT